MIIELNKIRQVLMSHMTIIPPTDLGHDILHIDRVYKNAMRLCESYPEADKLVVTVASIMHDCVPIHKNHVLRKRASELSAHECLSQLDQKDIKITDIQREKIFDAVLCHSHSANIDTKFLESKIVQDADRLDAIGAIGLARCFTVSNSMGQSIYLADQPFTPIDGTAIGHILKKIITLPNLMHTPEAKKIAKDRMEIIKLYLEALEQEIL